MPRRVILRLLELREQHQRRAEIVESLKLYALLAAGVIFICVWLTLHGLGSMKP